jgi:hypothetical protein
MSRDLKHLQIVCDSFYLDIRDEFCVNLMVKVRGECKSIKYVVVF